MRAIIGLACLIPGLILLGLAGWFAHDTRQLQDRADRVDATVTSLSSSTSSDSGTTYAPVYTYEYQGEQRTYESSVSSSSPPTVGSSTTLLVDPEDPDHVKADTFMDQWFLPALLGGLGAVFTVLGIVFGAIGVVAYSVVRGVRRKPTSQQATYAPIETTTVESTQSAPAETSNAATRNLGGPFVGKETKDDRGPFM